MYSFYQHSKHLQPLQHFALPSQDMAQVPFDLHVPKYHKIVEDSLLRKKEKK